MSAIEASTMNASCVSGSAKSAARCMPLTFAQTGEFVTVDTVRGRGETNRRLEELGFVPGASIRVVSEQTGNLIVEIKETRVAVNHAAASRILVK